MLKSVSKVINFSEIQWNSGIVNFQKINVSAYGRVVHFSKVWNYIHLTVLLIDFEYIDIEKFR